MVKKFIFAVLLASCLIPNCLSASVYVTVDDAPLARQAELIVRVEVVDSRVSGARGYPSTHYGVAIEEVVKGEPAGSRLEVRVPGGDSPELGRELVIHGAPSFRTGQRALLFLRSNDDGTYRVLHLLQGVFLESGRGEGATFVRDVAETERLVTSADGSGIELVEPARNAERFVAWLRDQAGNRRRPADYFVAAPDAVEGGIRASFTHLSSSKQLRWFDFDQPGGEVVWYRQSGGQPGLADGGKAGFSKAMAAWKNQTGAPIRLVDGGSTPSTSGFTEADTQNTILFEDFNEAIGDDFDCDVGGYIAVGGISSYYTTEETYKDQPFFRIAEAEIVVNDGVGCLFAENPDLAAQVYAHELGHTLGLGHACGDASSPKCSSSELLNSAIMRAYAHGKKGAELSDDDRTGARFLYDPDFYAVPCNLPPGHRKFCQKCGPCGEAQGSCRKDAHCLSGLECTKKVGEEFGLRKRANVCTQPR